MRTSRARRSKQLNPDVLTLDVEMPKMDGITFLQEPDAAAADAGGHGVLAHRARRRCHARCAGARRGRLPVEAEDRSRRDAEGLRRGADREDQDRLAASVRALDPQRAADDRRRGRRTAPMRCCPRLRAPRQLRTTDRIIAIGASTGGTEAIKEVLTRLPPDTPGRRHRPAHSEGLQHAVRQAHERLLPDDGLRGRGRPAGSRRARLHRPGRPASDGGARRRPLCLPAR